MQKKLWFCGVVFGVLVLNTFSFALVSETVAQEPAAKTTSDEEDPATLTRIRTLIRQLEANELDKRDEAETELVKLGALSLKFLPSMPLATR